MLTGDDALPPGNFKEWLPLVSNFFQTGHYCIMGPLSDLAVALMGQKVLDVL